MHFRFQEPVAEPAATAASPCLPPKPAKGVVLRTPAIHATGKDPTSAVDMIDIQPPSSAWSVQSLGEEDGGVRCPL